MRTRAAKKRESGKQPLVFSVTYLLVYNILKLPPPPNGNRLIVDGTQSNELTEGSLMIKSIFSSRKLFVVNSV